MNFQNIGLVILIIFSFAQTLPGQNADALNQNYARESIATFDNRYEGVRGTPFIFDDWFQGALNMYYANGQSSTIHDVQIKLDAFNQIVYANPLGSSQVLKLDRGVQQIHLYANEDTLLLEIIEVQGEDRFIQYLSSEDPMLIRSYKKIFKEADFQGAYSSGRTYDEYKEQNALYLRDDNEWVKVKTSSKFWMNQYPEIKNNIKAYFKKYDISEDKDVLALVNYIRDQLP